MAQERVEEKVDIDKYIQNGLKFPLDKQRIGFLTIKIFLYCFILLHMKSYLKFDRINDRTNFLNG